MALVFQPIYDVTTGRCFAVEALTRFSGQPVRSPDVWFAEAHELGVGVELELGRGAKGPDMPAPAPVTGRPLPQRRA